MEQRLDDLVGPDTRVIVFADLHGLIDVRRLQRWARWHRRRVALGVLATLGAASALADRKA